MGKGPWGKRRGWEDEADTHKKKWKHEVEKTADNTDPRGMKTGIRT